MKVEQLSLADYNKIKNIPVVNQDLSASGFTPVANTYYRHTGTTGTYKQGVIYYYDGTEYKALDGSGGSGGTTLNRYTVSTKSATLVNNIINTAKSVIGCSLDVNGSYISMFRAEQDRCIGYFYSTKTINGSIHIIQYLIRWYQSGTQYQFAIDLTENKNLGQVNDLTIGYCYILYYNDTEITG